MAINLTFHKRTNNQKILYRFYGNAFYLHFCLTRYLFSYANISQFISPQIDWASTKFIVFCFFNRMQFAAKTETRKREKGKQSIPCIFVTFRRPFSRFPIHFSRHNFSVFSLALLFFIPLHKRRKLGRQRGWGTEKFSRPLQPTFPLLFQLNPESVWTVLGPPSCI